MIIFLKNYIFDFLVLNQSIFENTTLIFKDATHQAISIAFNNNNSLTQKIWLEL